jgi:hypothetical protein
MTLAHQGGRDPQKLCNRVKILRKVTQSVTERTLLRMANAVPPKDRGTLLEASEWERLADQAQWATDLRQRE